MPLSALRLHRALNREHCFQREPETLNPVWESYHAPDEWITQLASWITTHLPEQANPAPLTPIETGGNFRK